MRGHGVSRSGMTKTKTKAKTKAKRKAQAKPPPASAKGDAALAMTGAAAPAKVARKTANAAKRAQVHKAAQVKALGKKRSSGKRRRSPAALRTVATTGLEPITFDIAKTRIIMGEADIAEGVAALRALCPVMRQVHDVAGPPPLRRREDGFEGLCRIIVAQQLSVASAAAIWSRTAGLVAPFTHERLLALSDAELAGAGLSRPKLRTLRAIASACAAGLDFEALREASDAAVHAALTQVSGIGPWTADIYLMFCLGRADAWAPGDLALQIAAQQAFGLRERPDKEELSELAERWRPWRAVAARLLWSYYAVVKEKRQAIPV